MSPGRGAERRRAPLALQIMVVLLVALLTAQAMTFAVILLSPPPRPNFYRMDEVAAALQGEPVTPRDGRALHRSILAQQPQVPEEVRGQRTDAMRRALAEQLAVPEAQVVAFQRPPPFLARYTFPGLLPGPGGRGPSRDGRSDRSVEPERGRPATDAGNAADGANVTEPSSDRRSGDGRRGRQFRVGPFVGSFTAALRLADGRWVTVSPEPEPFPTEWQKRMAMWLLGSLILLAPVGWLFTRRITAPMRRFAAAAETLGRDPQAPMMNLSGPAEIGAAADAFNDMQARIKAYVEDRMAMVGAISHDLRTPLSRIRFKLESLPDKQRDSILGDIHQMEEMITAVLSFIREASQVRERQRMDLTSLIECVVDDANLEKDGAVVFEGTRTLTVDGDSLALTRLVSNLVDNALKYAGSAHIEVGEEVGHAVIEVHDEGPGLPEGELERVFTPFYRASEARTLDADSGVGLGLAVARSIARAHGGDVRLINKDKGLVARVTLPLAR